jgi:hypothetical protein
LGRDKLDAARTTRKPKTIGSRNTHIEALELDYLPSHLVVLGGG